MREWNWLDPSGGPRVWREQLVDLRSEILGLVLGLRDNQANWSATPGGWSIAQCVDHLSATNAAVTPRVRAALFSGRQKGRTAAGPFEYGFLGRNFLQQVAPPPRRRLRAARKYRPPGERMAALVAADFARTQDALLSALGEAGGLDLARIQARSPAMWALRLPVGIWFASLAAHQARHLLQARRVREDARFPAGI